MSQQSLRSRFTDGGLETASPARIVVMAFDCIDRDLAGATIAIESRRIEQSHELLVHAQDLVNELLCMLDLDAWEHAPKLASIYRYVIELLVAANVGKSVREVAEARTLLAGLGEAFKQAAAQPVTATPAAAGAPSATTPVVPPGPSGAPGAPVRTLGRPSGFASADLPPRSFSVSA